MTDGTFVGLVQCVAAEEMTAMSEESKAKAEAEPNAAGLAVEAQAEIIEEAIGILSSVVNRWHHGVDVTVADWSDVARFARVADAAARLVKKIRENDYLTVADLVAKEQP